LSTLHGPSPAAANGWVGIVPELDAYTGSYIYIYKSSNTWERIKQSN
jgi:hypothetical protein